MVKPIGVILQEWAELDIFFYALPFLLIFALVFAILQKLEIAGPGRDSRGINAVIAIAVALLALQYDQVSVFFQIIFPKLGIALAVILAVLILMGLFIGPAQIGPLAWTLFGLGAIASIILIFTSFSDYTWWTGGFWQENMSAIIAGVIIIVFVAVVIFGGRNPPGTGGGRRQEEPPVRNM